MIVGIPSGLIFSGESVNVALTLDALERALWAREVKDRLIHHGDRGRQYLSMRYSERLTDPGIGRRLLEPIGYVPPAEFERNC